MPVARSAITAFGPAGITTKIKKVEVSTTAGAMPNTSLSAREGVMSSFWSHLPTSASSCRDPYGPASIGPRRLCMKETNLNR